MGQTLFFSIQLGGVLGGWLAAAAGLLVLSCGCRGWEGGLAAGAQSPGGSCCREGQRTMGGRRCQMSLLRLSRCLAGWRRHWEDQKAFWSLCYGMHCQTDSPPCRDWWSGSPL